MNVILSIKPEFCEKIINGEKKYEFRKVIFKNTENIEKVFIYSSSPVKKIIGSFRIQQIFEDRPKNLWNKFKKGAGISKVGFFDYFRNSKKGYAIEMMDVEILSPIDPKGIDSSFCPPQSFRYIHTNFGT